MSTSIGYIGSGQFCAPTVRRLAATCRVATIASDGSRALTTAGAHTVTSVADLARSTDLLIVNFSNPSDVRDALFGSNGLAAALPRGALVVDQSGGDPEEARSVASELAQMGIAFVDAPIHCESTNLSLQPAAILCGGSSGDVARARPTLEAICAKVIHCGDVGSGRAARILATTVATCNRYVTYECAAMGMRSGLSADDMTLVLNKSSGANSGTERILPRLVSGESCADTALQATLDDLRLATRLAIRHGTPMLVAGCVYNMLEEAHNALGNTATLDDLSGAFATAAGLGRSASGGWREPSQ